VNEQNHERTRKKNKEHGKTLKVAARKQGQYSIVTVHNREGAGAEAGSKRMLSSEAEQEKEKAKEKV
jgi:hypothetical protein